MTKEKLAARIKVAKEKLRVLETKLRELEKAEANAGAHKVAAAALASGVDLSRIDPAVLAQVLRNVAAPAAGNSGGGSASA